MRVCLVATPEAPREGPNRHYRRLASLLSSRHDVTLIHAGAVGELPDSGSPGPQVREIVAEPSSDAEGLAFANEDHRSSAAVLAEIERAYDSDGPDYVEVHDRRAVGLVPLMARGCDHPLLREARFAVRLVGSEELVGLHDGVLNRASMRLQSDLEREQLRLADRIVWPGGDVLGAYSRYHSAALPEATCIPEPFELPGERAPEQPDDADDSLKILFCGPLRRSRGALDLAQACLRLPHDQWRLTMIGADTPTAPAGQSVRRTIEEMFGGDPRLRVEAPPSDGELRQRMASHDLLVVPPTFDVWPVAALEAMAVGLPILATPVGGLAEMVEPDETGWLSPGVGVAAIRESLEGLLDRRDEVERVRASGKAAERARRLNDPERALAGYERLLSEIVEPPLRGPRRAGTKERPLVTGIIPYYRASAHVEEAVDSLLAQSHPRVEAIVVNDGSFEDDDDVLLRLAEKPGVRVVTQLNSGETSARNLGIALARGEYLVMLDSDNVLEPRFVARALDVFARDPDLAYVTCWLRFITPDGSPNASPAGYAPLGNSVVRDDIRNYDGDALALLPRRLFGEPGYGYEPESATHGDWELYRRLREDGLFGAVIPERLARYRVRPGSLLRTFGSEMQMRAWDEVRGRRHRRLTRWTAEG